MMVKIFKKNIELIFEKGKFKFKMSDKDKKHFEKARQKLQKQKDIYYRCYWRLKDGADIDIKISKKMKREIIDRVKNEKDKQRERNRKARGF